MRMVYRVLALVVCAVVAFQAAVIVWAVAGLGSYLDGGGVLDKAKTESAIETGTNLPFPEMQGLLLHGMTGMMIVPIIALLFLISSFFAKAAHARVMALIVVGLVALQMYLGLELHEVAGVGVLHGVNALLLFAAALVAFRFGGEPIVKSSEPIERIGQPDSNVASEV
ncbi:hypothetical protein FOE78_02335 [Microlunatus elymi]|uniref:Cytochrome c oxidase assembly protein subunit 15 n=1 Tax=Microlunatus elymi TaxID=2596828 RepID=A0A516PUP8_9ACTN|nr:hypothetical protein [Microlunatus elymi]QDP94907.1 hypothetical protein FOE78_02335 [Microlunatus elymi]